MLSPGAARASSLQLIRISVRGRARNISSKEAELQGFADKAFQLAMLCARSATGSTGTRTTSLSDASSKSVGTMDPELRLRISLPVIKQHISQKLPKKIAARTSVK